MTTGARQTSLLDLDRPAEIEAFERAFHAAFARATHNRLVRRLWEWDDAGGRLRTRVPYADQRIWTLRGPLGEVTGAIAVNLTLRQLQAAAYGFALPAELAGRAETVCEFLTFFAVGDHALPRKHALWRELFTDLAAAGYRYGLATTSPVVLPIYRRMGASEIGRVEIESEVRIFLQFDLSRAP